METICSAALTGVRRAQLDAFLTASGLDYDEGIERTVLLLDDDGEIAATGSLDGNVLKCIAVSPAHQGEGLAATVVSELRRMAFGRGQRHLLLFTKPRNRRMFEDLAFFPIAETREMLLMENVRHGIADFVARLERGPSGDTVGCTVMNCDPFTRGHRYLIETAAGRCDRLHVFVLSTDKSTFPADVRRMLVEQGTADLPNVTVHPTGDYLISAATFPSYFLKDKARAEDARCELDLEMFCRWFVPALGITRRFVGTEPLSPVTAAYNAAMKRVLPPRGVEVVELTRRELAGAPISASRVRALLGTGDETALSALVPPTTMAYLRTADLI